MKKLPLLLTLFILLGFSKANCQTPDWVWARSANSGSSGLGEGRIVTTDKFENIYVTGQYRDTISFGSFVLLGGSAYEIYFAKYDSSGNIKWAKCNGGSGTAVGYGIGTDNIGNSYLMGYFGGTIIFDSDTLISATTELFITKFDSFGNVLWAKRAGGLGNLFAFAGTTDKFSNSYLTGFFTSSLFIFGTDTLNNPGGVDLFLVKYDSSGNEIWARSAGSTNNTEALGIATDIEGNVYLTGVFNVPTVQFGSFTLSNMGGYDIFIVKYNSAGNVIWAKSAAGNDWDEGIGIAADESQNVYITGYYRSSKIAFGSDTIFNSGTYNTFLAKYDSIGNIIWVNKIGGTLSEIGYSIFADKNGKVYLTGRITSPSVVFDTITLQFPNGGNDPMFIASYDSSGHILFAKVLTSGGDDANGIVAGPSGNIYITSDYYMTSSMFIVGNDTLYTSGIDEDFFVAKLAYRQFGESVPEISNNKEFIFYPNPLTSSSILQFNAQLKNAEVVIYDMVGKEMIRKKLTGDRMEIEKGSLECGVYFVRVISEEGQWVEKLIIE